MIANLLRFAVIALIGFAAKWASAIPIYLLIVVATGVMLAIRLRAFPVARVLAAAVGLAATVLVFALSISVASGGDRAAVYVGVAATLLGILWVLYIFKARDAWRGEQDLPDEVERQALLGVALTLGTAPVALVLWVVCRAVDGPSIISTWLLVMAAGAGAGALMIAAIASAIRTYRRIDLAVRPILSPRPRPTKVDYAAAPRAVLRKRKELPAAQTDRLQLFALRVQIALATSASGLVNLLRTAGVLLINEFIRLFEAIHCVLVRARRRLVLTIRYARACLLEGFGLLVELAKRFARIAALPIAGVIFGAAAGWSAASHFMIYLNDGPIGDALMGLLLSAAVVLGYFAAWAAWSGAGWGLAAKADLTALETIAPDALLLFVAGGWVLGIAGWLGYGPIRPGPATLAATALLLVVVVTQWRTLSDEVEALPEVLTEANP